MLKSPNKVALMFYENNTFTSKGVDSVFNDIGNCMTINEVKIIRNTISSNNISYSETDLIATKEIWLLGVDKSRLPKKIKTLIEENKIKIIQIDMKSIVRNLQTSQNNKNSKNLRLERKGLRKGVILGILNGLATSCI